RPSRARARATAEEVEPGPPGRSGHTLPARIRGYVFDAYGTLFDVHSVIEAGRDLTSDPATLSALWRQKQLEYTWLRALMRRYDDFWVVTEAALRHTVRRLGLSPREAQISRPLAAYLTPACLPPVP